MMQEDLEGRAARAAREHAATAFLGEDQYGQHVRIRTHRLKEFAAPRAVLVAALDVGGPRVFR
jgi:hypothetical protein